MDTNPYADMYPVIASCIVPVSKLVKEWKESPDLELEVRFGKLLSSRYDASVSKELMDRIITFMTTSSAVKVVEWQQIHDYFHTDKNGHKMRTRVSFDTENLAVATEHIYKQKLQDVHLRAARLLSFEEATGATQTPDLRVSLSRETNVPTELMPESTRPHFTRIRQRKSILLRGERAHSNWQFDFTMSWDGKTRDECERLQATTEPRFDIECEIKNRRYGTGKSDVHVATSFLLKVLDVMDDNSAWTFDSHVQYA
tara:strand:+ start:251 stop:1018 length:768 start_codon:yes stop_codon:yes gene_type:complete